jgi:predicted Zn-dependent protease with MMP-like domain
LWDAERVDDERAEGAAAAAARGIDPATLSLARFDELVVAELDELPDDMVDGLDNVVFVTDDRPEDGSLDLLGLYDGVALTERGTYGFGELPDRIILYREPHLAVVDTEDELRDEIHVTLVHEIAHFYGIDDAQLHELGWA